MIDSIDINVHEIKKELIQQHLFKSNDNKKNIYELGPLKFKSKSKAKKFVSLWLQNSYQNYVVHDDDKHWILALLDNHPNKEEKIANYNGNIYVRKNPSCKTYYNFVLGKNHPFSDTLFSYRKCFDSTLSTNHSYHCKQAFRNEIRPQTFSCRRKFFKFNDTIKCPMTNADLKNDKYTHIDHHYKSFESLFEEFIKSRELCIDTLSLTCENGQDWYIENGQIKDDWIQFHENEATLVPVFRDWNLKREKTIYNGPMLLQVNKFQYMNPKKFNFIDEEED